MNEKLAAMATPKRALVGGHMVTILLTEYQADNDTYHGVAFRARSMDTNDAVPNIQAIHGLRPYPYAERPDADFQFVECGQDEQPLIDIAQGNAESHKEIIEAGKDDRIEQVNKAHETVTAELDPADKNADGYVSRKEAKKYAREHPDE